MKIAMDACSIILLAKASVLEATTESHAISITKSVFAEVMKGKVKMLQDALLVEKLGYEKKIDIAKSDKKIMQKLMKDFNMGEGEASTVAVALKDSATLVATDNLQGRKAALINNLFLIGSVEIVVSLYKSRRINKDKAITALKILKEEGWFSPYLIETAMEGIK